MNQGILRATVVGWLFLASACAGIAQDRPPTFIYGTGFEPADGFDMRFTLAGQQGWQREGTGGDGLLDDRFEGFGQQAYIGLFPPLDQNSFTTLWHPLPALAQASSVVRFSVKMQIVASTEGGADDFRWSVYNPNATRLFSLDFEGSTHRISYVLDDSNFVDTGYRFDNDGTYDLVLWMDFSHNVWSAFLNDLMIVHAQPVSTLQSALALGEVDAVWLVRDLKAPGNNYMLFDDYVVTGEPVTSIPAILGTPSRDLDGNIQFVVSGTAGLKYAVDVTSDFGSWFSFGTYAAPAGGEFIFSDTDSQKFWLGFYRVREVP